MRQGGLVLFMCAGLLLSGGAILGGSATWSLLRISYYFWTTDLSVDLAGGVLFIAGALLCLPACWLATLVPYHPKSQSMLATLLCVSTSAMLMLSMGLLSAAGVTRALRDPGALNASLHRSLALDAVDPAVRSALAAMQADLRCCGVQGYSDWYRHRITLPPSCCGRLKNAKNAAGAACESPLHTIGCLRPAMHELRNYANALTALSSAIIIILAVTVFAAAYTLVSGAVERQKAQPLRVAFLSAPQPSLTAFPAFPHTTYPAPPLGPNPVSVP